MDAYILTCKVGECERRAGNLYHKMQYNRTLCVQNVRSTQKLEDRATAIEALPAISDIHRSSVHENVLAPFDFVYVS